ncbi:MAG: hypothetical protein WA101_03405 [Minisyncoccia bacterium]
MKKSNVILVIIVIIIILLGSWYLMSTKSTQPKLYPSNTEQTNDKPVIKVSSDPILGDYLVASNGMTLYLFTKDIVNVSNCYDTCAINWPPYSLSADETLISGDNVLGKISTINRNDGSTQLAYNGIPLYFWKNDVKPGDTTGQNVGGVWFIVKP